MKRQHKSNGATTPRWDGPRTGKEAPSANGVVFSVIPVESQQRYANCRLLLLHPLSPDTFKIPPRPPDDFTRLSLLASSAGRGGPSKSWAGVVGGSAQPRPTRPRARPVRVTPATTGCSSRCGMTTTCHRAACASTTRPRGSSTPSPSSSRPRQRAVRHGRKWWTTRSSAASGRKLIAKEKETTEGVRTAFFYSVSEFYDKVGCK